MKKQETQVDVKTCDQNLGQTPVQSFILVEPESPPTTLLQKFGNMKPFPL